MSTNDTCGHANPAVKDMYCHLPVGHRDHGQPHRGTVNTHGYLRWPLERDTPTGSTAPFGATFHHGEYQLLGDNTRGRHLAFNTMYRLALRHGVQMDLDRVQVRTTGPDEDGTYATTLLYTPEDVPAVMGLLDGAQ